jgi:hypothetical protein
MTITLEIIIIPQENGMKLVQNLHFKPRWWIFPMTLIDLPPKN